MIWTVFSIIKAPRRNPTKSPRLLSYNNQRQRRDSEETAKRLVAKQTAKQNSKYECSKVDDGG